MNKREIIKTIGESLKAGKSKEDIYFELNEKFKDEFRLAKWLAMFPRQERKEKYKAPNLLLFILLILSGVVKVVSFILLFRSLGPYGFPLLLISPVLNIWLAVEVWKMRGYIYGAVTLLSLMGILKMADVFLSSKAGIPTHNLFAFDSVSATITILFQVIIGLLSFYIGRNLFPNYGWVGLKKGLDGRALF